MKHGKAADLSARMRGLTARRVLYGCLCLVTMALIFLFSSMNGEGSGRLSGNITRVLLKVLYPAYEQLSKQQQRGAFQLMHHLVRKAAHMTEFAVLAAWVYMFAAECRRRCKGLWAFGISVLYAATDEWHQSFVKARGAQIGDVVIDAIGALFGCLIVFLVLRLSLVRHRQSSD